MANLPERILGLSSADLMLGYYLLHVGNEGSNPLLPIAAAKAMTTASCDVLKVFYSDVTRSEQDIHAWANTGNAERKEALIERLGVDGFRLVAASAYVVDDFTADTVTNINIYRSLDDERGHIKRLKAKDTQFPDLNDNARPLGTFDNLSALVEHIGLTPAQNSMTLELEMLEGGKPRPETFEGKRSFLISEALKAGLPKSSIEDHLTALCEKKAYHPVREWLSTGEWDGVERVSTVINAVNAKDRQIADVALGKWFVAAVAALYEPNFTCKLVPVLQGEQSFKKTAYISRFADVMPHAFLEGAELNPDNKDSILSCIKSWVVELGELERTSKYSQGSLKAFITKNVDSVRPPYGRADVKKKRQTVFIASVNGTDFLRDETGSSRYAVVELSKAADMAAVNMALGWSYEDGRLSLEEPERLRQFWLEVKHSYDNGASWTLNKNELRMFSQVNDQHQFKDDYRVLLEERFLDVKMANRHLQWLKASEVCSYCDIPATRARAIGKALKGMAQDGLIQSKEGRSRVVVYLLPIINER
ncbi:VapE domain-containing protein [Enterovibrio norvegicus]|uniref:VapE domain-containing protein n=1 Tax=Enterovibrio norvegicus TaxID=188144 RepID=UPI00352F0EDE